MIDLAQIWSWHASCVTSVMRRFALLLVPLAGCSLYFGDAGTGGDSTPTPDAHVAAGDAPPYVPPTNTCLQALPISQKASCQGGTAYVKTDFYYMGAGTHSMCGYTNTATVQCTSGCAAESSLSLSGTADWEIANFGKDAALLCAETPEAQIGNACRPYFGSPCLPTRAHLNADGTVASQTYLRCDSSSLHCVAGSPPTVTSYLQRCDDMTIAAYGTSGANGRAGTCLLAWDSAMQRITSGQTRICLGDWDCPAGSLCDDQIAALDMQTSPRLAICKPGPRGTLTPAMLSP